MSEEGELCDKIDHALQILAQKEGVQRKNLLDLLRGELGILAKAWNLDLTGELVDVQETIYERLSAHLAKIPVRDRRTQLSGTERGIQFRRVSLLLYNAHTKDIAKSYSSMLLNERYEWLASARNKKGDVSLGITPGTARRDFEFARKKIAKVLAVRLEAAAIASGSVVDYAAVKPVQSLANTVPNHIDMDTIANVRETTGAPLVQQGELSSSQPSELPPTSGRFNKRRRAVLACGGVLALGGSMLVAGKLTGFIGGSAANPPSLSTNTGQLPSVSSTTGPVMVTSAVYMRDIGTPGAWSYAFAQTLSPSDVASYTTVSQNEQQYQQWALNKGGVTADDVRLQIGLRGNQNGTAVIQDIQLTKHCQAPLTGTLLYVPPQGSTGDLGIYFDLDQQFPVAEDADTHASYFGASNAGHTITLSHGEVATLLLDAVMGRQYCTFSLTLVVQSDSGQEVHEVVNDHGKPFQVTAAAGVGSSVPFAKYRTIYVPDGPKGALIPVNPQAYGSFENSTSTGG